MHRNRRSDLSLSLRQPASHVHILLDLFPEATHFLDGYSRFGFLWLHQWFHDFPHAKILLALRMESERNCLISDLSLLHSANTFAGRYH